MTTLLPKTLFHLIVFGVATWLALGCRDAPSPKRAGGAAAAQADRHLRIDGTMFRKEGGGVFQWRGLTAFRLLDYVADGREDEATRYLAWAADKGITVVRVLAMVDGFFDLKPADGRRALPRLLELAAARGIYVEIVALANTASVPVNLHEHVAAIGQIASNHWNALVEIANEPVHATQAADVQKADVLKALASKVPPQVPVALGAEPGEGFAAGRYVTWHAPRESGSNGWGHVMALAEGAALVQRWIKPVISDEPIGAGPKYEPGRRDNNPARFRAAALLTRLAGLGATFHYEGGPQARVPQGIEAQCFDAWNEAWSLLPAGVETEGEFRVAGAAGGVVKDYNREGTLAVYERTAAKQGWILVVGSAPPRLQLAPVWRVGSMKQFAGAALVTLTQP